jgi:trimeric autotransporter adhesin
MLSMLLVWWGALVGTANAANGAPATTRISDNVYQGDGSPASGVLLISWPAFTTSDSKPVAAGTKSVTLGSGGSLAVDLVPNTGATPSGSHYQVVFQRSEIRRSVFDKIVSAVIATIVSILIALHDHLWR